MDWLIFEGSEGIDTFLDREKNNKHNFINNVKFTYFFFIRVCSTIK